MVSLLVELILGYEVLNWYPKDERIESIWLIFVVIKKQDFALLDAFR
jgi:hypothetical protein